MKQSVWPNYGDVSTPAKITLILKLHDVLLLFCLHLDQDGSFAIGNFIKDAVLCRDIQINGDGTPMRSYLYSDDLIIWLFKILIDGKSCEPYNVGSDVAISILELAKKVAYLLNPEIKINIAKTANINALPERYVPSIQKARKELDLDVWTDLDNAILASSKGFK